MILAPTFQIYKFLECFLNLALIQPAFKIDEDCARLKQLGFPESFIE